MVARYQRLPQPHARGVVGMTPDQRWTLGSIVCALVCAVVAVLSWWFVLAHTR